MDFTLSPSANPRVSTLPSCNFFASVVGAVVRVGSLPLDLVSLIDSGMYYAEQNFELANVYKE